MKSYRLIGVGALIVIVASTGITWGAEPNRFDRRVEERDRVVRENASFLRGPINTGNHDYTSFYLRHLEQFRRPPVNINDYIFDKYFFYNPNVSPYLNLTRRNIYGNNYYQRVLPERARREVANAPRPKPVFSTRDMGLVAVNAIEIGPFHAPLPTPYDTGVGVNVGPGVAKPYFKSDLNALRGRSDLLGSTVVCPTGIYSR